MEHIERRFLYWLHGGKTHRDLEDNVEHLLDMFLVILKNDKKRIIRVNNKYDITDERDNDELIVLSTKEKIHGWNCIWSLFYDFYALNHPELEKMIYKKQESKQTISQWGDILNTFHYYSRHNEYSTQVYLSRQLYENVPPISFQKFKANPSRYNFLSALKTTPHDKLYKFIISMNHSKKIADKIIKTYKPWIKPKYDQTHILIAAWEYLAA